MTEASKFYKIVPPPPRDDTDTKEFLFKGNYGEVILENDEFVFQYLTGEHGDKLRSATITEEQLKLLQNEKSYESKLVEQLRYGTPDN